MRRGHIINPLLTNVTHGRLGANLRQFYPSLCNIQVATTVQDDYGQPIHTWHPLADHQNLPCQTGTLNLDLVGRFDEFQNANITNQHTKFHIALAGYFPAITTEMRAVVNDLTCEIIGITNDDFRNTTILKLERITT